MMSKGTNLVAKKNQNACTHWRLDWQFQSVAQNGGSSTHQNGKEPVAHSQTDMGEKPRFHASC